MSRNNLLNEDYTILQKSCPLIWLRCIWHSRKQQTNNHIHRLHLSFSSDLQTIELGFSSIRIIDIFVCKKSGEYFFENLFIINDKNLETIIAYSY